MSDVLEFLANVAVYAWPWGEKRWWKLGLILGVALVLSIVIAVTMAN